MVISRGFHNLDLQQSLLKLGYYLNGTSMILPKSLLRVANLECVKQDLVGVFRKQWEQFSEKIHAMGKSITALTNHYDDLKGPRFRALEKPMDKINELQLGQDSKNKTLEE